MTMTRVRRWCVLSLVALVFAATAESSPTASPACKAPLPKELPQVKHRPQREIAKLLEERTDEFRNGFEPGTTLETALDWISKRFGVVIRIDNIAFMQEGGPRCIGEKAISLPEMPNVRVRAALRDLVRQLEPCGAWVIHDGELVLTTAVASMDYGRYAEISVDFHKKPLCEAIEEVWDRTGFRVYLDTGIGDAVRTPVTAHLREVSAETLVGLLAASAELHMIEVDRVLVVTTAQRRDALDQMLDPLSDNSPDSSRKFNFKPPSRRRNVP